MADSHTDLTFDTHVNADGHVDVAVPLPPGSRVKVIVLETTNDLLSDFSATSESSMRFWDNPWDDEDWSDASAG